MPEQGDIEVSSTLSANSAKVHYNPELERFKLANRVLLGIAILSAFSLTLFAFLPASNATAQIFELVKVVFPPIVTLILGAYFRGKD